MFRLNLISATAVAVVLATGAEAADMPVYYEPQPEYHNWYLRGDIGASHQVVGEFSSPYWDEVAGLGGAVDLQDADFDASFFIGGGIGYRVNDWFRVDVTGEYRFESDFHGLDHYDDAPADGLVDGSNEYSGSKEEAVFLVNAYYDFPTWGAMTPYVGAGVGAAWLKMSDFTDYNPTEDATGLSGDVSTWNFAFALYAGLAFAVNDRLTFDVGYRYLYMGDIETDDLLAPDGTNDTFNPFNFEDIASHDIKIGLRYAFY
jgi:opacity protein-like surface antigen